MELAYLDPGTGSVILQALLGGIAGVALTLKLFGRRVLSFFRIRRPSDSSPEAAPETEAG
jgi:hypothetical protein